jgi:hypothetical protein
MEDQKRLQSEREAEEKKVNFVHVLLIELGTQNVGHRTIMHRLQTVLCEEILCEVFTFGGSLLRLLSHTAAETGACGEVIEGRKFVQGSIWHPCVRPYCHRTHLN